MTKGTRLTEDQKTEIRKEFKGGQKEAERLGKQYGVHYTTIYGVAKNGKKPVKAASPKRKTAKIAKRAVKPVSQTQYTEIDWDKAFDEYIETRDAFQKADKHLKEVARGLK